MENKICNICNKEMPNTSEFFSPRYYKIKTGERRMSYLNGCRACYRDYHKENHTNKFQDGDMWLACCEIVNKMKDRTRRSNYKEGVEWSADDILPVLVKGVCQVTGFPFKLGTSKLGPAYKNPFSASPDRIDNTKGYTKDNTRFVVFIYNAMRNNFREEDVEAFMTHIKTL